MAGGSKLPPRPPLPQGAPSGGRDGGGRRVLSQSKGCAGLRGRGGARNAMQPGVGGRGFCPGRRQMLRFRFAVSLVLVHAEERGPGGWGRRWGACGRRRGRWVCAVRSEGLFQREPSSRANSQSPVGGVGGVSHPGHSVSDKPDTGRAALQLQNTEGQSRILLRPPLLAERPAPTALSWPPRTPWGKIPLFLPAGCPEDPTPSLPRARSLTGLLR